MKALFGMVGLLIALVIVGWLATWQLKGGGQGAVTPGGSATAAGAATGAGASAVVAPAVAPAAAPTLPNKVADDVTRLIDQADARLQAIDK